MTRFVYVLPAGRLRWEVRVKPVVTDRTMCECGHTASPSHTGGRGANSPVCMGDGGQCYCMGFKPKPEVSLFYRRKAHALIAARAIAIIIGGEVQPHNRWGRIQDPDSYGGDSPRRRG